MLVGREARGFTTTFSNAARFCDVAMITSPLRTALTSPGCAGCSLQTPRPTCAASPACQRRAQRRCLGREARRPPRSAGAPAAGCTLTRVRGKWPVDRGRACWSSGTAGGPVVRRTHHNLWHSPPSLARPLLRARPPFPPSPHEDARLTACAFMLTGVGELVRLVRRRHARLAHRGQP